MENNNEEISMNEIMGEIEKSMKRIHEGDVVKGTVVSVSSDEVLVNIGYMADGIISSNELSQEDILNPGDEIYVYILKINDGEGNVALSKKKADEIKTWDDLQEDFNSATIFKVKVSQIVRGGAIAYINGIRAFIPASHISYSYVKDLNSFINKEINVKIIEFDKYKGKVVLSAKEVEKEEVEKIKEKLWESLQKGEKRMGTVTRIVKFGAFVDLGGVEGLIHLNDLSWKRVNNPSEVVSVGDKVSVYVLDFDKEKNRISLGLKDVAEDPWKLAISKYKVGEIVEGKVVKLLDFGAFVELEDGLEGLVHITEISDDRILKPSDVLNIGDRVKVKILEIDEEAKKMSLSIKAGNSASSEEISKYNDNDGGVTLGDLLKDKFKDFNFEK
ncbi:30S ribosomal protein S1 [Clostridium liquoris]|uniref:30S ribosomal protein S1 n=1 Tax=Clostridium liquoris TaxID=1289519 RepID=A0A2T0B4L0_9CLOT|nr:30S ribosomal protein S1 [Clostridium liquoris]PRR78824.1 30S ribosomal protein S1 [Clostridium liquoris]